MKLKYIDSIDVNSQESIDLEITKKVIEYGNLFLFEPGNDIIIFKPLTFKMFNKIKKAIDCNINNDILLLNMEDYIVAESVVFSSIPFSDTDDWNAGIIKSLATVIMLISGPNTVDETIDLLELSKSQDGIIEVVETMATKQINGKIPDDMLWADVVKYAALTDSTNDRSLKEIFDDLKNEIAMQKASQKME